MQLHPLVKDRHRRHRAASRSGRTKPAIRIIDKTGPARQSRRPRPLHPVHGGRAADLRPPDRRGLRGRRRRRSAHRRAARQDRRASRTRSSPRDYHDPEKRSIANALTRRVQGRHEARRRSWSSTRSATSAGARKACRCWWRSSDQPRAPLPDEAAEGDPRAVHGPEAARGEPVNEFVDLMVIMSAWNTCARIRRLCRRRCRSASERMSASRSDARQRDGDHATAARSSSDNDITG